MIRRWGVSAGLVLFLTAILGANPAWAKKAFDFREAKLDNGLRVITMEDFSTPIVAVQLWYHVGSKDEQPDRQGFAHMFEHMMFRGTDLIAPEAHLALIRQTGGYANAFTWFDFTGYVNTVPSNQLELVLWLEAQRMMYLNVDQAGFDTERKVVEEERRMRYTNRPYGTMWETLMANVFTSHPYRWTPIGNIPDLRAASLVDLQAFWDKFYVPNNATLVIVGAVKHKDAQVLAKKYFGWIPKETNLKKVEGKEPEQTAQRELSIEEPLGPAPSVGYIYRALPDEHPDAIPLRLLIMILGSGESSRLYQDLVKERKVATEADASAILFEDDGIIDVSAYLLPGGDTEPALAAIDEHIAKLREAAVSERELSKVKNQFRRASVTNTLTVESKANELAEVATVFDNPNWVNEKLKRIEATTAADLLRVAKQYLTPERRTLLRVIPNPEAKRPDEEGTPIAAPSASSERTGPKANVKRPDWFPTEPPIKPLLDELPKYKTVEKTLMNGLRVVVIPNNEVPFVNVKLGLMQGSWAEDPASAGAANLALQMLTQGTKNYTSAQLAEEVEFNALTLSGSASLDVAEVNTSALSDKLPLALKLLAEVALRPTFPEDEFKIAKEQLLLDLKVKEEDAGYLADRELRRRLYGEHPYARSVVGEVSDVEKLTPELAKAFWEKIARPDSTILYIAGDVKPREAFRLAEQYLGEWSAEGASPSPALPPMPHPDQTRIYLVDKPGAVQSEIRVAQLSLSRKDPDFHKSRVYMQILGGNEGRLNKVIRVERGLTYSVYGTIMPNRFSGAFVCDTFTKTASTADTVKGLLEVVQGMSTQPATAEELGSAKSYLAGRFPSQLETPESVLEYAWIIDYNNLPKDYLNIALKDYKNTEPQDIFRLAASLVDPNHLVIVVCGEAATVKEGLEKIAPVTVVEETTAK